MSMLVAELLELARLDRTSSLDLTETDLAGLAIDAVADARAVEPDRPVHRCRCPPASWSPPTSRGSGRCSPTCSATSARTRRRGPRPPSGSTRTASGAVIEVSDAGPGHVRAGRGAGLRPFPPRRRATARWTATRGGHDGTEAASSGLGLSIVQAIAAAHGGCAQLRSAPGAGHDRPPLDSVACSRFFSRTGGGVWGDAD